MFLSHVIEGKDDRVATFESFDNRKKALDLTHVRLDARVDDAEDKIESLATGIQTLETNIALLGKEVAATTGRKWSELAPVADQVCPHHVAEKLLDCDRKFNTIGSDFRSWPCK